MKNWNYRKHTRRHLEGNNNFRRKKSNILLWIIIIILGILVITLLFFPNSFQSFKSSIANSNNSINLNSFQTNNPSIKQLSENPEKYLNKEITINGEVGLIAPMLIFQTTNPIITELKLTEYLWEENKITVPSSRYSFYIKASSSLYTQGWDWKCKGEVKEYKGEYYFEASYCEED